MLNISLRVFGQTRLHCGVGACQRAAPVHSNSFALWGGCLSSCSVCSVKRVCNVGRVLIIALHVLNRTWLYCGVGAYQRAAAVQSIMFAPWHGCLPSCCVCSIKRSSTVGCFSSRCVCSVNRVCTVAWVLTIVMRVLNQM